MMPSASFRAHRLNHVVAQSVLPHPEMRPSICTRLIHQEEAVYKERTGRLEARL